MKRKARDLGAALDAVYAKLPALRCKGLCAVACGPIPMTVVEADRLRATAHVKPRIVEGDGHEQIVRCVYLTPENRCGVYRVRPLICRVWGMVKRMSCMHGCEPDRWLSDAEFVELAREVERIGRSHVVTSPEGVAPIPFSFHDLDLSRPFGDPEADAEQTRSLRALLGGRVIAVTRDPGVPPGNYQIGDPEDMRRLRAWQVEQARRAVDEGDE